MIRALKLIESLHDGFESGRPGLPCSFASIDRMGVSRFRHRKAERLQLVWRHPKSFPFPFNLIPPKSVGFGHLVRTDWGLRSSWVLEHASLPSPWSFSPLVATAAAHWPQKSGMG